MSKIRVFLVELENNKDVYFQGDIVVGNVVLELCSQMQIEELKLTFTGEAKITWWDRSDNFRHAAEQYFKQSVVILESDEERKDGLDVQEGVNKYPFIFELPPKLPTSFEYGEAHVRYLTKVTLETNMWNRSIHCSSVITVVSHLDLNEIDNIEVSSEEQVVEHFCCLCCKSGPVTGILRLDRTGYIPVETINVNVEFRNMSRYTCNIYVLGTQLTVTPDGFSLPFDIKQRIIIGTIPLQSVVEKYNIEYLTTLSTTPTAKDFQVTFKESGHEGRIEYPYDNRFGQLSFKAKYPYYDWLKNKSSDI